MRVSPRELKAVRAGGLVSRYAMLGDAVFVVADLPDAGTAGTSVEEPCRLEHWGLVLQGELTLLGRRGRTFGPGTAFYVAPGPVHRFRAASRVVVAGFAPVTEPIDESPEALQARGIEILSRVGPPPPRPDHDARRRAPEPHDRARPDRDRDGGHGRLAVPALDLRPAERLRGAVVRPAALGLRARRQPGPPLGGQDLELLGPGDVFHCPGGPPGHRMEVADSALVVDYTPMSALDDARVRRAARTVRAYVASATRRAAKRTRTARTGWTTRTSAPSRPLEPGTARRSPDVPAGRTPARPVQAHRSRSRTACNRSPPMLSREAPLPDESHGG